MAEYNLHTTHSTYDGLKGQLSGAGAGAGIGYLLTNSRAFLSLCFE